MQNAYGKTQNSITQLKQLIANDYNPKHWHSPNVLFISKSLHTNGKTYTREKSKNIFFLIQFSAGISELFCTKAIYQHYDQI